jgi:tripartite-type tricarboxylate transporter receptor subunit TctC
MKRLVATLSFALVAFGFGASLAQGPAYPERVVKIVVPFPPGGATDTMTRMVGQKLNEAWKQPVVIENKPGANGMIGADSVAKSQHDGYTLLAATIAHSANVSLFPNATYQFQKDLRPIAILGLIPLIPVVNSNSPIHSLSDLVAASKRRELNGGSGGNGTAAHLTLELFKGLTGARIQHVPYKGGAPAMTDLLGGQIDVIFALAPECLPHIKSGRLRALAVTTEARYSLLPDVPTTSEAGVAGLEVTSWNGLMVPAGTPAEIVAGINAAVTQAVSAPELRARIIEQGYQPAPMNVGDTEKFVRADVERWARVIREANIKAD